MDNKKQAEVLQKVLELEKTIITSKKLIARAKADKYKDAPTRKVVMRTYPEIKSTITFDKKKAFLPIVICMILNCTMIPIFSFLSIGALVWPFYYYFGIYKKQKNTDTERIKNSAEYKLKCEELDKEFDRQQEENNKLYEQEKREYEIKLAEWTETNNRYIENEEVNLKNAETELANIYAETKIVPVQYRNIEALQYITDMVCSSDYDVKQAIENYDKKVQRDLEMIKIEEQQIANELADEQAYLLQEQNKIASKARRDANVAAAVGIVQRHNTNKILKGK